MAVSHVNIPAAKDIETLRQHVEHSLNLSISQVNGQTGKLSKKLDAQGNTITNLPMPSQGGDAVPLKYLQDQLVGLEVKRRARSVVRPLPLGVKKFHVIFKAAIAQNGSPLLGMSFPTSSVSGVVIAGSNVLTAAMQFQGTQFVQDHFPLPDDWAGPVDLTVYWLTSSGTANPTWSCQLISAGNGSSINPAYNAATTVVSTATTSMQLVKTFLPNINVTGVAPGDLMLFKFGRSDSGTDNAGLLELKFDIRRNL
jgi:hypothetical protein